MEVIKISNSKLKIILTREDMQKYRLKADSVDYNNAATRKSFFEILDTVKSTHGFDSEGDKVLIQFYPSKDGGCELFITKLGLISKSSEKSIASSDRVTMLTMQRTLYKFSAFSDLLEAARIIGGRGEVKSSDVFFDRESPAGSYILEVIERSCGRGTLISGFDILLEYSDRVDASLYPYITEHCVKLTDGNALTLLCGSNV